MKKTMMVSVFSVLFWIIYAVSFAQTFSAGKVMIVLDASGSMWGQINTTPKIEIARTVIKDLLQDWDQRIELGLSAYGHRQKSDCNDIEILVPVGANTKEKILSAIQTIQPKGKTPLTKAVELSAQSLKYSEDRATVILISDGEETCDADPCALGSLLEKTGVDFTTHVIGFGLKGGEEAGLQCLAKNTGGLYAAAKDAGSLKSALEKTVVQVKQKAVKPVVQQKPEMTGVKVTATYKSGGPQYLGQINWSVLSPQKDLSGKQAVIAQQYRGKSGHIFKQIPLGSYVLRAELSDARYIVREYQINIDKPVMEIEAPLDIGTVRFDAYMKQGGKAYTGDIGYSILDPKKDLAGKHKKLTDFWRVKTGRIFILPAGTWKVAALFADARYVTTQKEVVVQPAGEELHEFVFNAATVRFDAFFNKDTVNVTEDIGWSVLHPKKDLAGNHKKLADFWRVKSGRIFILPAGEWLVSGVLADYRHVSTQKTIDLSPDDELLFEFDFNAGKFLIRATTNQTLVTHNMSWDIFLPQKDLSGNRQKITGVWRVKPEHLIILHQGDYLIKAFNPDDRALAGQTQFTSTAGQEGKVTIELKKE